MKRIKGIIKQLVYYILVVLQAVLLLFKRRPVILLMDCLMAAGDNSEAMYHYLESKPGYKVYYILKKGCSDWDRLSHDTRIINYNSLHYLFLYLQADIIFTAYSLWLPRRIAFFRNKHSRIVWLQHGVGMNDISRVYNASNGHDLITLATRPEYEARLGKEYGYHPSQLVLTGLAHWDLLENKPEKIITISLTWRKYIKNLKDVEFIKTEYYSIWEDLIISPELFELVNKYNYKIQFLFHHEIDQRARTIIMKKMYPGITQVTSKTYNRVIAETALLITDYSSVAFDMAYLNKPIVYYHKDAEEIFSGKHTYTKSYYDYERDGFGEVVYDKQNLLKYVEFYIQTDCQMQGKYLERAQNTFVFHDQNNRERIWNEVESRFLK